MEVKKFAIPVHKLGGKVINVEAKFTKDDNDFWPFAKELFDYIKLQCNKANGYEN